MVHEFIFLNPIGEDSLLLCDACGYAANREVATCRRDDPAPEEPLPLEEVATPGTATITALADLLGRGPRVLPPLLLRVPFDRSGYATM